MSEPWTRAEQINYATFGSTKGVPEYNAVWHALHNFARVTNGLLGESVLEHFIEMHKKHIAASMSVD